jgi:hypothetical protein
VGVCVLLFYQLLLSLLLSFQTFLFIVFLCTITYVLESIAAIGSYVIFCLVRYSLLLCVAVVVDGCVLSGRRLTSSLVFISVLCDCPLRILLVTSS